MYKLNVKSHIKSLLLFFVLLGFGGVFSIYYLLPLQVILLLLTTVLIYLNRSGLRIKMLIVLIILLVFILIQSQITQTSLFNYNFIIISLVQSVLLISAFNNDYKEIKRHLYNALVLILIISSLNLVLINLPFDVFAEKVNEVTGYKVETLFTLFNKMSVKWFAGIEFQRNQGSFWEPGILQILINVLLFIELFEKKKISKLIVLLSVLIIISTFSTTGFVILFIILFSKFRKSVYMNDNSALKKILVLCSLLTLIPLVVLEIVDKVTGVGRASFLLRTYDFFIGLKLFSQYPIFGIGYNVELYNKLTNGISVLVDGDVMSVERGNTNSFVMVLVFFGLFIFLLLGYSLYKQSIFSNRKLFFILIVIALSSEPLIFSCFIFILLISSIANKENATNSNI